MNINLKANDQRFLRAMDDITSRQTKAQTQIASGRRIQAPSDAPDEVGNLLAARADRERVSQIQSNLDRVKTEIDTAEIALQASVRIADRARVLGAQGVTGTQTGLTRRQIATEVSNLLQQLANQANTVVNGRYIFSGDADGVAAFLFIPGSPPTLSSYLGNSATREVLHPSGGNFPVAKAGDEIFSNGDPEKNIAAALTQLHAALTADNEEEIKSALAVVSSAGEYMNDMLAYYGTVQNQVSDASSIANGTLLNLKAQISEIEDTDMTGAIVALNRAAYEQQAALGARAKMPTGTLFDYMR